MASPLPFIGPYRLLRKLGEGGMGEVFEAVHQTIERQVAIKILRPPYARDPRVTQRFLNEARAVNLIKHPGLVQISDFGQMEDGSPYIVMEYLRGETLGQRLRRMQGRLPLSEVLHTVWQVGSALVAAHEMGIVHRDLKPDNIMLVPDLIAPTGERAKLLDFGIARFDVELNVQQPSLTGGSVMGTPTYMSPEQCRGVGPIGAASDVYSLGVMLYQLLAGRPPFASAGVGELLGMHMSQPPPALLKLAPETPAELAALVERLLAKDPEQRPSMLQVVSALEQMQAPQGALGRPPAVANQAPLGASLGLAPGRLSDSLAGLLGSEIEEEGSEAAADRRGTTAIISACSPAPEAEQSPSITAVKTVAPTAAAAAQLGPRHPPATASSPQTLPSGRHGFGAGESLQPAGRGGVRRSIALPIVLVGGGGILLASWLLPARTSVLTGARPAPHAAAPVAAAVPSQPAPPAAPAPVTVSWSVATLPSGARVVRADTNEELGITPWRTEATRREGSLLVRLRRDGYVERELRLDYRQSCTHQESLTPLPQIRPPHPGARRLPGPDSLAAPRSPSQEKAPDAPTKPVFEVID